MMTRGDWFILVGMNEKSLFSKIIDGEIPCQKIYEDETTLAFLDIMPATEGHVLVIPKRQVEFVWDLSDDEYDAVMRTARLVAHRIRAVIRPKYVGELIVGTDVPHAHVHVVPFDESKQLRDALAAERTRAEEPTLQAVAEKLRFT